MGYSNRISQHMAALRHYLMAEAETGKPFNSERERNAEIESILDWRVRMLCVHGFMRQEISEEYPGFAGFLSRFAPSFHIGFDSGRTERGSYGGLKPSFDIYIVKEEQRKDIYRIFLIPDNKDFLERIERLARLRKTFEKYEDSKDGLAINFSAEEKVSIESEKLVKELLTESTIHFNGSSVRTSDTSEKNVLALDKLLMNAIKTIYPKNLGRDESDEAMVEIIRLCDSERKRAMLSERSYFEDFFSSPPYCWSRDMIMLTHSLAQHEEILLPDEDYESDEEDEDDCE